MHPFHHEDHIGPPEEITGDLRRSPGSNTCRPDIMPQIGRIEGLCSTNAHAVNGAEAPGFLIIRKNFINLMRYRLNVITEKQKAKMYTKAIVRRPGRNFAEGITTSDLGRADFEKALGQHTAYCEALKRCGLEVTVLEADESYPDGCFVEDTAVVTGVVAVITRPGALSRRGEEVEIGRVLSGFMETVTVVAPGTLEGGDVLRMDNHYFIGISERTSRDGAAQLSSVLANNGYTSTEIEVKAGLHLKSDIAYLGNGNFIATPMFAVLAPPTKVIILEQEEYYSANCLRVNDFLLIPSGFPKSKKRIADLGYNIIELDMSEFRKMDGGLTCLSLLF